MPTITGETSAGVAAVNAKVVASADYNGSNQLVLTLNDATTINAGTVNAATTAIAGVVELSTDALAVAGVDATTAVTPHALAAHAASVPGNKVQSITSQTEASGPSSYPAGISLMNITTGWSLNGSIGIVVTVNNGVSDCQQTFYSAVGTGVGPQMWTRTYASGWTSWGSLNIIALLTPTSFTQASLISTYPLGDSRLYYTTANSTSWDFTGKAGEVWTYNDGATLARQTFTRTQGGIPNFQEQWVRTNDFVNGWTPWHQVAFKDAVTVLGAASAAITAVAQTAVAGLAVPVEANATYLMEAFYYINSTVSTTGDATYSWTGPTGATMVWGDTNNTTTINITLGAVAGVGAFGDVLLNVAAHQLVLKGTLKTSTTPGTLTPTFGVTSTSGTPSYTLQPLSYLRLTRVA